MLRRGFWRRGRWQAQQQGFHAASGRSILAGWFARGEIDEQEYRERLAVLNSLKS